MDGAIVNPVPVTTARALGADLVVCVNLNGDIRIRGTVIQSHSAEIEESDEIIEAATEERRRWSVLNPMLGSRSRRSMAAPGIADASWSTPSTSPRTASPARASPAIPPTS